ncbi:hypothetical protein UlMin_004751 [Ulmus minor]
MAFKRPFFLLLIFHVFTLPITDAQLVPYRADDNIVLDCGSSENKTAADGRIWGGDINNKIFPLDHGQNKASIISEPTEPSYAQVDPVPYGTARLSRSEFTYTIPVTPGPKFIRLYFYATNYQQDFDRSKAFFSVKTGQYTLLNNFSTSLTADFRQQQDMMKEFCVTVEKSILNITFTPTSSISEAFAFINGIEVVSMPANLSYPDPQSEIGQGINFVGQGNFYTLENNTALETAYRINIGGQVISPSGDTGMFRKWDVEYNYLTEQGGAIPVNTTAKLQFTAIPAYTAPEDVYKTARSTGAEIWGKDKIMNYTLTWQFPVDNGFNFLVRLHFCEIVVNQMKEDGDRVFNIFLAKQSAETRFDIIHWSGGTNVPFKKDFVVSMKLGYGGKKVNLSVALQPISDRSISKYLDAILNGVEIFKLSDTNGNLAAPNPEPTHSLAGPNPDPTPYNYSRGLKKIVKVVLLVVVGVLMFSILGLLIFRQRRKVKNIGTTTWALLNSLSKIKSTKTKGTSFLFDTCRYFSLVEIKAATNNFDESNNIGVGGFGNVYKGFIDGGITPIAIKRLKPSSSQGAYEFKTEIEMLSQLRHRHIVSLLGYCDDHPEMILVYEYMERGTLSDHLYNTDKPPLSWEQRLEICIGAVLGLHYLHFGAKKRIIHRDVKSTNILLDEKWVAKVSDFGLSKLNHLSRSHITTVVKGSFGYLDPEYYKRQQLTEKSDVYSFGVVLCEVLCGRPPLIRNVEKGKMSLAQWFQCCYHDGNIDQIVDPHLMGEISPECLKKYSEIAMNCMLDDGGERPSMKEVAWSLELSLQLQRKSKEPATRLNGEVGVPVRCFSWDGTSGAVFSEINDLNAR